ncbi:hypothetical protein KIPB_013086, partial [Kipferlia bialata]|eukprot:g13086.t1
MVVAGSNAKVHTFYLSTGTWSSVHLPLPADIPDHFGRAVAIFGDTLFVGNMHDVVVDGVSLYTPSVTEYTVTGTTWLERGLLAVGDVTSTTDMSLHSQDDLVAIGVPNTIVGGLSDCGRVDIIWHHPTYGYITFGAYESEE